MKRKINNSNLMVRDALKKAGMYHYELANLLNIHDITLSRWLREELPIETQEEYVRIIEEASHERNSSTRTAS